MKVVRIQFKKTGKRYFFSPGNLDLYDNENVVVQTIRGVELGTVVGAPYDIDDKEFGIEIKEVLRIASLHDVEAFEYNKKLAKEAFDKTKELIKQDKLDMKLLDAEYTLDRQKLIFYFESENRVDFRELVKQLAETFRTRIELRQVGSRDGAKNIGGLGPCGLAICCTTFLTEFSNVSIKMAKNQSLSLNPSKISGSCGKLLCCINYENDVYTELRKNAPDVGDIIKLEAGDAKVLSSDVLNKTCKVKFLADDSFAFINYDQILSIKKDKKKDYSKEENLDELKGLE